MPILVDPSTGRSLSVDLAGGSRTDPADLPDSAVQAGLPATFQRVMRPTTFDVEAYLVAVPGVGDSRDDVQDWIEEAATQARRLRLVIEGVPTGNDLMIGTRTYTPTPQRTTVRLSMSLKEVRVITQERGALAFPPAREDLRSGRSSTADLGECSTEEATPEQVEKARGSAVIALGRAVRG